MDAFLNTGLKIETGCKDEIVDVERVEAINESEFEYLKTFNFCIKSPQNWLLMQIKKKFDERALKRLKLLIKISKARLYIE